MSHHAPRVGFTPRTFALCVPDDTTTQVVGWGMTLPDGSAVAINWRTGPTRFVAICRSPDNAARLHGADIVWTAQPAPPP